MATAYLLCGSTGAGKTTYSKTLAKDKTAQVFSIDEWMQTLFWKDAPKEDVFPWAVERVNRCENQIRQVAARLLDAGVNVILDLGFSKREHRERYYAWARQMGHEFELHYLEVAVETRRERVRRRNADRSDTFQFEVSDEMFDWMESYFEAPQGEELAKAVVTRNE